MWSNVVAGTELLATASLRLSVEYGVADGNKNGHTETGQLNFKTVAHVQYFQTDMYYSVLPLDLGLGDAEGTRRASNEEFHRLICLS
jgi:hypothetical protein